MPQFAALLSRQLKQPVFDRTALQGFYDVRPEWRPYDLGGGRTIRRRSSRGRIQFHAIAAQLVIDHVDREPEPN